MKETSQEIPRYLSWKLPLVGGFLVAMVTGSMFLAGEFIDNATAKVGENAQVTSLQKMQSEEDGLRQELTLLHQQVDNRIQFCRVESRRHASEPPVGMALEIPQESLAKGDLKFLEGCWNNQTGLVDERNNPVNLQLCFDGDGKGSMIAEQSDGSACTASAKAIIINNNSLEIINKQIRCPDGKEYPRYKSTCMIVDNGTKCYAANLENSNNKFSVVLRKMR